MKPFSIHDPVNHISLKLKPMALEDKTFTILIEVYKVKPNTNQMDGKAVEFFLSASDVDFITYLYHQRLIPKDGYKLVRGKNGIARAFRINHTPESTNANHLSISLANGKGTVKENGFTTLKEVINKIVINITFEQAIKMVKFMERSVIVHELKFYSS